MSYDPIHKVLEALPEKSLTTRLLGALDYVVPGEWQNITNFEAMIKSVTGEEDQDLIQRVGEKAIQLYNDPDQGYHRAVQIFQLVDNTSGLVGLAALANKLGHSYESLSFLENVTPKADKAQAVDAGVKFVAELAAFCYCNGIPGDSVGDFVAAVTSYAKEDAIRYAAWLCFDCILPLGPGFLSKLMEQLSTLTHDALNGSGTFGRIAHLLPGGSADEKKDMLIKTLAASSFNITSFVATKGLDQQNIFDKVKQYIDVGGNTLEYVAAAIDVGTSYYEHTGIQSVSRRLISRAYGEI